MMDNALASLAADPSGATTVFEIFAEKGILGVVIIILLIVIRQLDNRNTEKDKEIKFERDARLDDAKVYRDAIIGVNEKVHDTVAELSKIVEFLEKNRR